MVIVLQEMNAAKENPFGRNFELRLRERLDMFKETLLFFIRLPRIKMM